MDMRWQQRWLYTPPIVMALQLLSGIIVPASAYGPIFTPHFQVPGEGSINALSNIHDGAHGVEWENGLGYGVNRALGINIMATLMLDNEEREKRVIDVGHVDLELMWRVVNFDSFASKRAIVFNLNNRFTSTTDTASGYNIGDFISGSVGYLEDRLHWIAIADFRIDRASETAKMLGAASGERAPETAGWMDFAVGWRFYNNPETRSDAMWTLDTNTRLNEGRALYVGSELIYQPHETMLFKAGYRYPVAHEQSIQADAIPGGLWAYEMEFRF